MIKVAANQRIKRRPLVNGRMMTCPRCKRDHDILRYIPLIQIEEYSAETAPIYKCPHCRWVFAPISNGEA